MQVDICVSDNNYDHLLKHYFNFIELNIKTTDHA